MMRTTIHDPRITACEDAWELEMSMRAIMEHDDTVFERWERSMGILWIKEELSEEARTNNSKEAEAQGSATDRVRIPLAFAVRPELAKFIDSYFVDMKRANSHVPKDTKSMFDMSKEDFKSMMARVTRPFAATGRSRPEQQHGFKEAPTRKLGD